jgi:dolichyl-diphosphooligosaccharide--protein glycosyltransferase
LGSRLKREGVIDQMHETFRSVYTKDDVASNGDFSLTRTDLGLSLFTERRAGSRPNRWAGTQKHDDKRLKRVLTVFCPMSQPPESESVSERLKGVDASLDRLEDVYHLPVLSALFVFMLWVRAKNWSGFVQSDGTILFRGNDPWYHYRSVEYTVRNFPATMPFDPWTSFPLGTSVGQFGTLFDQLMAAAALLVGLGSPTTYQIQMVMLFTPAVLGALTIIPVYIVGAQLSSRVGGLTAALVLALSPGQFLSRSLVGFTDHHVAETLFMAIGTLAVLRALHTVGREKPIWEQFLNRELEALRPTLISSGLAGVAVGLYIWVWPPGVLLLGIIGVFVSILMILQYLSGSTPEHVGIAAVIIGSVAAVMTAVRITEFALEATELSLLQPLLAIGIAIVGALIAGGARVWGETERDRREFPALLSVAGVLFVLVLSLVSPDTLNYFLGQLERIVGLGSTATSLTVGEAQPPGNPSEFLYNSYGLAFFLATGGILICVARVWQSRDRAPAALFLIVLGVFLLFATLTQQRFDYYLILPVAVASGVAVSWVFELVDLSAGASALSDLSAYQVLTILAVLMILTVPMTFRAGGSYNTVMDVSDRSAGPGNVENWEEALSWVATETPETYGSGEGAALDYYGTYDSTADFAYPEGSYGLISWWDYGHWITVLGERPAFANPFQQQAREAANFLLANNESSADELLRSPTGEQTRYVMIDYLLANPGTGKFFAPAAFETQYGVDRISLSRTVYRDDGNGFRAAAILQTERSIRSMRTRLYHHQGSAIGPESPESMAGAQVVVVDWELGSPEGVEGQIPVVPRSGELTRVFGNLSQAESFVREDGSSQIGGLPGEPPVPLEALEQYRLVHTSPSDTTVRGQPWVKTFEHVEGATIQGEGPANGTVTAIAQMTVPGGGQNFTYRQVAEIGADGQFEMRVPYSTTGYEGFGPENGYTNVSVRASGPYVIGTKPTVNESSYTITNRGRVDVTEAQVVGSDPTPASADLERVVLSAPGEPTNETNASADEPPAEPETTEKGETPASPSLLGALATMAARATGVVTSRG